MDPNTKRFLTVQLVWIGISLAISIALSILLPFPISLVAIIAVFILMSYFIRKRQMQRMGLRDSMFGSSMFGSKGISYYCMNCGTKHNQTACPNCGSKLKKAGFGD